MRLTCPGCGARYDIDAENWPTTTGVDGAVQFRPRRAHCHRCDTVWEALPAAADDTADIADNEWDAEPPPRRRWWLWAGTGLLALAAIAAATIFALNRSDRLDLRQLPALPALELPPLPAINLPDMHLPSLRIELPRAAIPPLKVTLAPPHVQRADANHIWEIRGAVHNPTRAAQSLPPVEVRLLDAGGTPVLSARLRLAPTQLPPGGSAAFATSLIDPAGRAATAQVRLRPAELGRP